MDPIFGIHLDALSMREKRAQILATNLINANTPHYKAKDLDFNKLLTEKMQGKESNLALATDQQNHLPIVQIDATADVIQRPSAQPSADGNTVDDGIEQNIYTQNSVQYLASLSFINDKIKTISLALRGE
jgi:flagellar basal-body rod protein FlgB